MTGTDEELQSALPPPLEAFIGKPKVELKGFLVDNCNEDQVNLLIAAFV